MTSDPRPLQWPPEKIAAFARKFVLLCVLLVLAWIVAQGYYAVASADDFCFGAKAHDGIFNTIVNDYLGWDGRYSSTFFITWFVSYKILLTKYYFVCPLVILAANLAASKHFLKKTGVDSHAFALIFFVLYIASFSLRETVFWLSGGFTYGLAAALFISLIGEEFALFSATTAPAKIRILILSLGAFFLAGFNETVMVAHIALLGGLLYGHFLRSRKISVPITAIMLCAIIGAIIVYLAPGNAIRSEHFPPHNVIPAAIKAFFWVFWRYAIFFLPTCIVLYSALILFAPAIKREASLFATKIYSLSLFLALWGSAFTRFYSKVSSGPERTHTIDYAVVTLLAFIAAWHCYRKRRDDISHALQWLHEIKLLPHLYIFLTGTFLLFMIRPVMDPLIIKTALHDINYASALHKYMATRFHSLPESGELVQLPDDPDKSKPITYFDDITPDPDNWRNICFANNFGLGKVQLTISK